MKLKAYKVEPENVESDFFWYEEDNGRAWGVVSHGYGGYKSLAVSSGMIEAAWLAADYLPYDDSRMGDFLYGYFKSVYFQAAEFVRLTGANWRQPKWREAVRAVKEVVKRERAGDYTREAATAAILTCASGTTWAAREICGVGQNDWAMLIYPRCDLSEEAVEEIEARYFNTGDGWNIEDESGENVGYCYTWKWDAEEAQIREYMRGRYGEDVEVELYDIEGYEPRKPIYRKRGEEEAA